MREEGKDEDQADFLDIFWTLGAPKGLKTHRKNVSKMSASGVKKIKEERSAKEWNSAHRFGHFQPHLILPGHVKEEIWTHCEWWKSLLLLFLRDLWSRRIEREDRENPESPFSDARFSP